MAYDVYIGDVLLPITPSSMQISTNGRNTTVHMINDGEINVLKSPSLSDVSFDMLIPQTKYPFQNGEFHGAEYYTNYLKSLMVEKKTVQYIVSRMLPSGKHLFDTNLLVSLEGYTVKEDAGNGFDLMITVKLKQYKPYSAKSITVNPVTNDAVMNEQRPGARSLEETIASGTNAEAANAVIDLLESSTGRTMTKKQKKKLTKIVAKLKR